MMVSVDSTLLSNCSFNIDKFLRYGMYIFHLKISQLKATEPKTNTLTKTRYGHMLCFLFMLSAI